MYDKYMIVAEEFKNVEKDGEVTGFQFGARLPYYRGVVLSLVGEMDITVDGEKVTEEQVSVTVSGKTFPLAQLKKITDVKWEFGDVGIVTVEKPGGLSEGEHEIEYRQNMKISYVPGGFWGSDEKVLTI